MQPRHGYLCINTDVRYILIRYLRCTFKKVNDTYMHTSGR